MQRTIAHWPRRGCRISCSNISTAVPTTRSPFGGTSRTCGMSRSGSACFATCPTSISRRRCSGMSGRCRWASGRSGCRDSMRAAAAANVPMALSTVSGCSLREVAASGHAPWFQLYFVKDRGFVAQMIETAKEVGSGALILTVDLAVPGSRYRDYRAAGGGLRRMAQLLARPEWLWDVGIRGRPISLGNLEPVVGKRAPLSDFQAWIQANFDPSVNWKDVEWVRKRWTGPLVIKGILDPEDAKRAAVSGADAIVVSNHGGRQLDGVLSSARALPPIADAVDGRLPVLADGGIRSGLDVVRMLALGADFVLLGRTWAYALAGGGGAGVAHVLRLIEAEMRV